MAERFLSNPIIRTKDLKPSQPDLVVECVLNPGVFLFEGKTWLLLRVAERPIQKEKTISFPVLREDGSMEIIEFNKSDPHLNLADARMVEYKDKTYLSTISHLRLVCSNDGVHFYEPEDFPTKIFGKGLLETFGIEDSRVSLIDGEYHLTYTQVSENGVGVGLMRTRDWRSFTIRIAHSLKKRSRENTTACTGHRELHSVAISFGLLPLLTFCTGVITIVLSVPARVGGTVPALAPVLRP